MLNKSFIFGMLAVVLTLPTAAFAGSNDVVVQTIPVRNTTTCVTAPVTVKPNSGNTKVTQHRVIKGNGNMRTEVYQSTTTSTSTTRAIEPMCVLPQGVMNNLLILP
ncbi:MAG: hypothetical protein HC903_25865 [Methylacidiphilales bacterium]|nr:hypothetical protein [Candidatus Methylacidiphilales bacterium]NJR15759.1 hypothetical protein [Calothrix sp. CSU_2_0]